MTTTPPKIPTHARVGGPGDELVIAQIFERPDQSLTRPAVGVYLFEVEHGEYQVSLSRDGVIRGDATLPEGLTERMSEVLDLSAAKTLMGQWMAEAEAAVRAEWKSFWFSR